MGGRRTGEELDESKWKRRKVVMKEKMDGELDGEVGRAKMGGKEREKRGGGGW